MVRVADLVSQFHDCIPSSGKEAIEARLQAVRGQHITEIRKAVPWYDIACLPEKSVIKISDGLWGMAKELMEILLQTCSEVVQSTDEYEQISTKLCPLVLELAAQHWAMLTGDGHQDDLREFKLYVGVGLDKLVHESITEAWSRHASHFQTVNLQASPDSHQPTQTEEPAEHALKRENRLQEFLRVHPGTTVTDVRTAARVHKPEMQRWRHGVLPDKSAISERIVKALNGMIPVNARVH